MHGIMSVNITSLVGFTQEMRAAGNPYLVSCYRVLSSSSLQQPPPQLPIISHQQQPRPLPLQQHKSCCVEQQELGLMMEGAAYRSQVRLSSSMQERMIAYVWVHIATKEALCMTQADHSHTRWKSMLRSSTSVSCLVSFPLVCSLV